MNRSAPGLPVHHHLLEFTQTHVLESVMPSVQHSICQQIWKMQQWPQDWKRSVFIPIPKKDNVNVQTTAQLHLFYMLASESEVAQLCQTLRHRGLKPTRLLHPWDSPGKSTGLPFLSPGESSRPRDGTLVSCIAGRRFNLWATTWTVHEPRTSRCTNWI